MKFFRYFGEAKHDCSNNNLHTVDYLVVTTDVISTVIYLYDEELQDDYFYEYPRLLGGRFGRQTE